MPLTPGTRLGPYEIVSPLGAGGMGEVYRARDTRLSRDVAIKVLPEHLSSNAEVRQRFEREAKTVSSLNHPHICTLYDVGKEGEVDYLVMELVDGETLAQRLEQGALPAGEVLRLGAQVADALDRAHRAGVVHRDLKPGNVMLTRAGVKLLDFGLARAIGLAPMPGSGTGASVATMAPSPTLPAPLTAEGTIVGTFQYMAPEQLEGKEADARSDIWAFGCVVYEMATGRRAFDGPSQASLIAAILKEQPRPMPELAPLAPAALERVVSQCLEKHPDDRWQSAGDLRRELEWIKGGTSASGTPSVTGVATAKRRGVDRGLVGIVGGAVIAALALAYAFGPWAPRRAEPRLMRFSLTAPPGMFLGTPAEAELSPDGNAIVYGVADSTGTSHLCLRVLSSPEGQVMPGTEHGGLPFWSPDSKMIAFFSDEKLRKMSLDGTQPLVLCDAPDPRGGSWSKHGEILFAPNNQGPIVRVSVNGGATVPITTVDKSRHEFGHRYPQFLPDGKHFLYVAIGSDPEQVTYAADIAGGKPVEVCKAGSGARYAPPGYLLFLDTGVQSPHRRLLAKRFDVGSLKASGDAELVIDDVKANNFGYPNLTVDDRGTLVVEHWPEVLAALEWRDRSGALAGPPLQLFVGGQGGALSPDSRRFAYGAPQPSDLAVLDLTTRVSTRVTFENRAVNNILWSNDGQRIVFGRLVGSKGWLIYMKAANGSGADSLVFQAPSLFAYPLSWSRDGKWLVAQVADSAGSFDLWRIPMDGQGKPEPYQVTPVTETGASISPDGHWLAYAAQENGKSALYVQSFPQPGSKYQVVVENGLGCKWGDKGDELLVFTSKLGIYSVPVTTTDGVQQGTPRRLFILPPATFLLDVERGEQRFLCGKLDDSFRDAALEVVFGWPQLLGKK